MNKKITILAIGLFILIFAFATLTLRGGATRFGATNVTPTAIPSDILTQLAASATPLPTPIPHTPTSHPDPNPAFDPQKIYPHFAPLNTPEKILAGKLEGSVAGYGILSISEAPFLSEGAEAGAYVLTDLSWEQWTYNFFITIWAGHMSETPSQGVVWVQIMPHYNQYQDIVIVKSPVQAGSLTIMGAVGERLILKSDQGQTFYFDVPGTRYFGLFRS